MGYTSMLQPNAGALSVSHRVLRILIAMNWLFGAAVLALLIWTFVAAEFVARALGTDDSPRALLGMRLIMVVGVLATPITNAVLSRLLWITPWLAVLLLFVLARVFEHGARMREDLDGTV